jgi:hypothetical protein
MKRIRVLVLGGAAVVTIAGMSVASANSGTTAAPTTARAQVVSQLQALEHRAAANPSAVAALQRAEVALQARQSTNAQPNGKPADPPPPCPSAAPNAGNPQPCGKGGGGGPGGNNGGPCPSAAPNAGGLPPCGHHGGGGSTGGTSDCGPADAGGTAATGPLSGPLYNIGLQITAGGGAPLGDAVQTIACALFGLGL